MNADTSNESNAARHLRLAKNYWLKTVWEHIKGRRLFGAELCIAMDAHCRLHAAKGKALKWNHTEDGRRSPVALEMILELDDDRFLKPEPLFADKHLTPEKLATIAAPLVRDIPAKLTHAQRVRIAHELLIAAEDYVRGLPKEKPGLESQLLGAFQTVTFEEIVKSMEKDSEQLPFLPGVRVKQERLTMPALRMAVRRFQKLQIDRLPKLTEQEFNREQEQEKELTEKVLAFRMGTGRRQTYQEWKAAPHIEYKKSLEMNRISLQTLCDLRWERFETFMLGQSKRRTSK